MRIGLWIFHEFHRAAGKKSDPRLFVTGLCLHTFNKYSPEKLGDTGVRFRRPNPGLEGDFIWKSDSDVSHD